MPVDVSVVDDVAGRVAAVYRQGEATLLVHIARMLAQGLDAPNWAVGRLSEIRALRRDAAAIADQIATRGNRAVAAAVSRAYRSGRADAVGELADLVGSRESVPRATAGGARRYNPHAVQALADAAVQELRPVHAAILPQAETVYRRAIAGATARSTTGTATTREAAQAAWAALVDKGITGYTDTAGRRWRLESYVAMATRTAAHRAAIVGLTDEFTDAGQRLVTVPDRPRECRLCRPWEHEVLALWGPTGDVVDGRGRHGEPVKVTVKATLDEARAAGLFHPNCRHTLRAYVEGETRTHYHTADLVGEAAESRQRYIERQLRRWREREAAALIPEGAQQARRRVAEWDMNMVRHLKENPGLRRLQHREHIGAGYVATVHRGRARLATGRRR